MNEGCGNISDISDAMPTHLVLSFCISILAVNERLEGRSCSEMSKSSDSAGAGRIGFGCCCPVAFSVEVSSLDLSVCATKKNTLTLLISLLIALKMLPIFVFVHHFYKCTSFCKSD